MDAQAESYLERLLPGQAGAPASSPSWLSELRARALERANALRVPTTRDEDWRFTDPSPLYKVMLEAPRQAAQVDAGALEPWLIPEAASRLVFVDGSFAPGLSSIRPESGVVVAPLGRTLSERDERVQSALARIVSGTDEAFSAVNTAWLRDGAVVLVSREREASDPIHLLFLGVSERSATYPRSLVVAERGSCCTVVEDYASLHTEVGLTNAVSEIHVGEGASVRHVRLQREGTAGFHIGTCGVRVARDGRYRSVSVALGARLSRYNLQVAQAGEGTDFDIDGLALISGRQLADTHSFVDHALPHGRSRQLHKCVVGDAAHAVFNGKILVRPGAQRTDSAQESRNLLLTQRAQVDTKPQLEIFADDVKCGHGATVGQLDAEQVFYLRSRGLSESAARDLLTFAFAAQVVERIALPSVVRRLEDAIVRHTRKESRS